MIVFAAAIGYAVWVGRDRPRAYHALMLFLLGAVVATFAAQDLLLFYVSFEAMLIPLYVLVGVWGGERRQAATRDVRHLHDGGLAAHARVGRRVRRDAGDVLADRVGDERQRVDLPRLRGRVRGQGAAVPVPRLAAAHVPPGARRGGRGALRGRLEDGDLRLPAHRHCRSSPSRPTISPGSSSCSRAPASSTDRCSRSARPTCAESSRTRRWRRWGSSRSGVFAFDDLGLDGAVLQSVAHGLISASMFLLVGMVERRCGTGELDALGGMATRPTDARDRRARRGDDRARRARIRDVRGRVPDHGRRLRPGLGLLGRRRARSRARGDVHPARDLRDPAREAGPRRA